MLRLYSISITLLCGALIIREVLPARPAPDKGARDATSQCAPLNAPAFASAPASPESSALPQAAPQLRQRAAFDGQRAELERYAKATRERIEQVAQAELERMTSIIELSAAKKQEVLDFLRKQENILQTYEALGPEETGRRLSEIGSLADVLGERLHGEMEAHATSIEQEQEIIRMREQTAYLAEEAGLTPEQQEKVLNALLVPMDVQWRRSEEAYLAKTLELSPAQRETLVAALDEAQRLIDEWIARSNEVPPEEETLSDGGSSDGELADDDSPPADYVDLNDISRETLARKLKAVLSTEQYDKLLSYQAKKR